MSTDAQRAAFEKRMGVEFNMRPSSCLEGEYAWVTTQNVWVSWQAATEHAARICERLWADASNSDCADAIRKGKS